MEEKKGIPMFFLKLDFPNSPCACVCACMCACGHVCICVRVHAGRGTGLPSTLLEEEEVHNSKQAELLY